MPELASTLIMIEIAYAQPDQQWLLQLRVPIACSVGDALALAGPALPQVNVQDVGIFGRPCSHAQLLHQGDRIEIYRPLIADAKQQRRERAATAGKSK